MYGITALVKEWVNGCIELSEEFPEILIEVTKNQRMLFERKKKVKGWKRRINIL
jgi:hypothetical protein